MLIFFKINFFRNIFSSLSLFFKIFLFSIHFVTAVVIVVIIVVIVVVIVVDFGIGHRGKTETMRSYRL